MNIPDKAVGAIAASITQHFADYFLPGDLVLPDEELDYCARKFATAAAPHIAAQALREQVRRLHDVYPEAGSLHYVFELTDEIRATADELDHQ